MLKKDDPKIKWFEEARLGMFIHWGIYSATEGFYNGKETKGIVEWIQSREEIPIKEYEKFAQNLSTEKFDAAEIAELAKQAGAKYVTFTSKHHEGFAMYDTKYDDYGIMSRCKAHVDPVEELCREVRKRGMHPCLYYSQSIDFHEENAWGNTWDFETPNEERDLYGFINDKTKFQLNEILTNYGDIDMIWFDVPRGVNNEMSVDLRNFVLERQPQCLINGRLCYTDHDSQDFICMGDNETPLSKPEYCAETCATTNDSWGYKRLDKNFKSKDVVICLLCSLVSKGVNLLLNIGPKPDGSLPEEAVAIFKYLGEWMQVNSEAVYATKASPFMSDFSFGWTAQKDNNLYIYLKKPEKEIEIYGLENEILKAQVLGGDAVPFRKEGKKTVFDTSKIEITKSVSVIKVELDGVPRVAEGLYQQEKNHINLPGCYCKLEETKKEAAASEDVSVNGNVGETVVVKKTITVTNNGIRGWRSTDDYALWDFEVENPGEYEAVVYTLTSKYQPWVGGHKISVCCADEEISAVLKEDVIPDGVNRKYFAETGSIVGTINFKTAGKHTLVLKADKINEEDSAGLAVTRVILKKCEAEGYGY